MGAEPSLVLSGDGGVATLPAARFLQDGLLLMRSLTKRPPRWRRATAAE